MAAGLTFRHDPVGDILYIDTIAPYAGQESDKLDDEVVGRFNPGSGVIENLEVLFFSKRVLAERRPRSRSPRTWSQSSRLRSASCANRQSLLVDQPLAHSIT